MGLGVGLLLSAVGAVLAFAVNATVSGVDIHTIGWILLIVGIVGILLSLVFWSSWAGPGYYSRRRTVVDDGPGIDEAHLPSLFDPLFTTKEAGTGLGLALVRAVAEAHGGSVLAGPRRAAAGARFVVSIPA